MKPLLRFALCIVAASLAISAQAKVEPSEKDLLPTRRQAILDRITSPEVGAKDAVRKTDALVCIMLSPGWLDILAVTPSAEKAKDLAEAIDSQLTDITGVRTAYGTSGIYGVADVTKDNSKWFQKHAELSVQAGQIYQSLKSKGFTPEVVLRVPKAQGMAFEPEFSTTVKSWRYRILKDSETNLVFKASSEVTPLLILGTVAMCSGFLIVGAIGFVVALVIARKKSLDIKLRRNLYYKVVMGSVFGSMMVHFPFFIWFSTSGYAKVITDSWMGSLSVAPFMLVIMIPVFFLPLVLKRITKSEQELYGTGPSDVAAKVEQMAKAEKARQNKLRLYIMLPMMVVLGFAIWYMPRSGSPRPMIMAILGIALLGMVAMSVFDAYLKKKESAPASDEVPDRVSNLAQSVADSMGVKLKKIVVNSAELMEVCVQGTMSPNGILTLSKGAVEKLSDDELQAVIAHECGHYKLKHYRSRIAFLATSVVLLLVATFALPLAARWFGRTTLTPYFGVFILSMAMLPFRIKTMQKQESEADRLGLEATRNYLAIESAFQKMVANSPMPGMHDINIRSHPAIGKRLAALRDRAASLGLPTDRPSDNAVLPPKY